MRSNIVVIALLASVCAQFGCASESNQMVVPTYKTVFSQMPEAQEKSRTALLSVSGVDARSDRGDLFGAAGRIRDRSGTAPDL